MIEFLWFLILVATLVGLSFARAERKSATRPEAQHYHGLLDRISAWCARFSPRELRWWLVIGIMIAVAYSYIHKHELMRVALNLLLFFEWHTVFATVLLALSVVGFIFAWRNELTRGGVVGAGLIGGLLALLVHFEWYCLLVILLTLGLLAVLGAWRERWGWWAWIGSLMIVFLAAALFLSHVLHGVPEAPPDTVDYVKFALVLAATLLGGLWAWRRRARLLGWTCAFLAVVLIGGLILSNYDVDVPQLLDDVDDYALIGLGIVLVVVAAKAVWSAHLQPLGWVSAVMVVFLGGGLFLASNLYGEPEDFADIEDQFKYGSIGSDNLFARGVPYFIWQVLPDMFPPEEILTEKILPHEGVNKEDYRPRYGKDDIKGKTYEAFGLFRENNKKVRLVVRDRHIENLRLVARESQVERDVDRPIGFSKRKVFGLDFIGMNCAFCHASTLRKDGQSKPQVISAMPANTVDIELYFLFLFGAAEQPEFKSGPIMKKILKHNPDLKFGRQLEDRGLGGLCQEINNSFHRLAYRIVLIRLTRIYAAGLKQKFYFIDPHNPDHLPRFGPGRVDAWSPGKATLVKPPLPVTFPGGIIDHMSIWNQKARTGMRFHWDGNTNDINERNIIAGLVVNGPQIECLDIKRVRRITDWIMERPAPRFDDFVPQKSYVNVNDLVERREKGRVIFQQWCASCHAPDGDRVGRVEPLDARELNTDPARMKNFTAELQDALNTITRKSKYPQERWELRKFRTQDGYVNMLLDGIWLRAPYLHNGSVPTMRDLLNKPCEAENERNCRPRTFYRGNDLYDWNNVGFTWEVKQEFFLFDTTLPGNSNKGHLYGTDLLPDEKEWLIEFLKTL